MTTVEFEYNIGDKVEIKSIEMDGFIDGLSIDQNGKQYRTVYWNDGERFSTWLYSWELEIK